MNDVHVSDYHRRKDERTKHYREFVHGWKLGPCSACNGSGHYDHIGSPPCGWCGGTGKERRKPEAEGRQLARKP